ncbi:MAG TPA: hypothetical protein VHL53_11490 [Acidimicrobiia bacterium]|nr:hypothetical protein [Acidimicrobiia bacterium]
MDVMIWLRANWDRTLGWVLVAAGVVALLIAGRHVSDARYLADQLSYLLSGGIGGLACIALGAGLLITAGLHDEWRKLDGIEEHVRQAYSGAGEPLVLIDLDRFTGDANLGDGPTAADALDAPARRATRRGA